MSKFNDNLACDKIKLKSPKSLVEALADGLKQLWSLDISQCPLDSTLNKRLEQAKFNIINGLVD